MNKIFKSCKPCEGTGDHYENNQWWTWGTPKPCPYCSGYGEAEEEEEEE